MHLFRIDSSINGTPSASRALGDIVESAWRANLPDAEVIARDLHASPLPADAFPRAATAGFLSETDRSPEQNRALDLAAELVDELISAGALLIDAPLYNYGISQQMKAWVDLIHTDPRSAGGSQQILAGVPAVLVITRGGSYAPGSPREGWDFATGYLTKILGDLWGAHLTVVERDLTLVGVNSALDRFAEAADRLHDTARHDAEQAGRQLASRVASVSAG